MKFYTLIFSLALCTRAYGDTYFDFDDKTLSLSDNAHFTSWILTYRKTQWSSPEGRLDVFADSSTDKHYCTIDVPGARSSYTYDDLKHQSQMRSALGELLAGKKFSCPTSLTNKPDVFYYMNFYFFPKDFDGKNAYLLGIRDPVAEAPIIPVSCSVQIGELDFGTLEKSAETIDSTKDVKIILQCNDKAFVKVIVNHGKSYKIDGSDTIINFKYDNREDINCAKFCSIPIEGNIIGSDLKPGKYKWAVPVLVQYL
ncbi:hypothetical protein NPL75_002449 [Vibrio cholerae]|nr:hypothetical protein [Vibrio cholerae]